MGNVSICRVDVMETKEAFCRHCGSGTSALNKFCNSCRSKFVAQFEMIVANLLLHTRFNYPRNKQFKATDPVLEQAELFAVDATN